MNSKDATPTTFAEPTTDTKIREDYILGHPPRLSPLPPQQRSSEQQEIMDAISTIVVDGVRTARKDPVTLEVLIRHAELYNSHLEFGKKFLSDAEMPVRDRELAVLRIGWLSQAPFEWGAHVAIAKRNGISSEEIERVIVGSAAQGWSEHEAALIQAMEELHFGSMVSDETWATLARTYTDKQLIEVPLLAGQYKTVAYLQNCLRLPLPSGNEGLSAR